LLEQPLAKVLHFPMHKQEFSVCSVANTPKNHVTCI